MQRIPASAPQIPPLPTNTIRPLWSVMIPVYNCSAYIPIVLESVLKQDLGADQMQIEVVDDASTDTNVEELVQKIGKGRVSYYRQVENVGSLRNFETCINRSKGRLVHLLHGDDNVRPGFYKKMSHLLEKYPEAGAAFCRNSFIDESGKVTILSKEESKTDGILNNWLIKSGQRQRNQYVSTVVRREVYEKLGSFYGMTYGEDWEMWVRIAKEYPIAYTPEVLSEYRGHAGSISSSKAFNFQLAKDLKTAIALILNHIPENERADVSRKSRIHCARFIIGTANAIWSSSRSLSLINKQMTQALSLSYHPAVIFRIVKFYIKIIIKK